MRILSRYHSILFFERPSQKTAGRQAESNSQLRTEQAKLGGLEDRIEQLEKALGEINQGK
jgi:hypothetical protein